MEFTLRHLATENLKPKERPTEDLADVRHRAMMEAIAPYAKPTIQKNLTPVYVDYKTRKTKLALVLCPEWSPYMPPFSLARLSGVAKTAGYETNIYDLNVIGYNAYRDDWWPNKKIPFRLWDPSASWRWLGNNYKEFVHPLLEPILTNAIDKILDTKPDVVGFSVYYISEEPTKWMCQEIKRRAPHIKIAVGGPNVHKSWFVVEPYYDYVVVGEGELNLLKVLEDVENGNQRDTALILNQPEDERLNINGLPMPDYESIDFSLYELPNGVNSEISRGCTAKCTFCEETHFWKYRQRQAVDLITEIEWLYYNKGTDIIWFIDSLVNGNLKELRAFCKAVAAKGLKINWTGYARCDGRMDLEYFKDLKAGGCIMFNYGCESGSQKVLDDMNKGVTIAEMEENFKHGKEVGIWAATNWIVGFPTEDYQDFADTMTFMWRNRNMNINNAGLGVGYGLGPETIVGQNPHKFNVSWHKYQGFWISNDFKKGGSHVMARVKFIHMWLDMFKGFTENPISYPIRTSLAKEHYKIEFDDPNYLREIEYEKFDYNIIPSVDINNPYANSLVNEPWTFFRMLWKIRGGFTAEIYFNPGIDKKEFGDSYGACLYTGVYKFKIDKEGRWEADFYTKFDQIDNPYDDRKPPPEGRKGPFYAQDYSRIQANTAKRARKLAKPSWSQEEGRSGQDFADLLNEEAALNASVDFSFEHKYSGTGNWGNFKQFEVDVSDTTTTVIPEKEAMTSEESKSLGTTEIVTIPITNIKRKEPEKISVPEIIIPKKQDVMLIAGCSHAAGSEINGSQDSVYNRQHSFGNFLARKLNKIPINIGIHSISNAGIARATMSWIDTQYNPENMNLSVLVAWTDSNRIEVSRPYEMDGQKISRSADWYDLTQKFVYNINLATGTGADNLYKEDEFEYFKIIQRFIVESNNYLELQSLQYILMLQNFLKTKNINYVMCNTMILFNEKHTIHDYYIKHIDQTRFYNLLDQNECFYWKYKNLGYVNSKAKYWHHGEEPHRLYAEELYNFIGESKCF